MYCEEGDIHGALSYFLLKTLKDCVGFAHSHKDVYHHIRDQIRRSGLRQHPILYGHNDQGFLGYPNLKSTASVPASKQTDVSFQIAIGQAHGVRLGDEFILEALGPTKPLENALVVGRVAHLDILSATLETLIMPLSMHDHKQWQASSISQLALREFPVRLASSLPDQDEWLIALASQSLCVHAEVEQRAFSMQVALNESNYEIRDATGQRLHNLPVMSLTQTSAQQMGAVLKHLARFQLARSLGTVLISAFRESFTVRIDRNGISSGPEYPIEVEDGTTAALVIENQGLKDLYVYVYNLGPY